jgi:hypothetical protein
MVIAVAVGAPLECFEPDKYIEGNRKGSPSPSSELPKHGISLFTAQEHAQKFNV